MPFGRQKGTPLSAMTDADLTHALGWCREKDAAKFADLIASIESVLESRRAP